MIVTVIVLYVETLPLSVTWYVTWYVPGVSVITLFDVTLILSVRFPSSASVAVTPSSSLNSFPWRSVTSFAVITGAELSAVYWYFVINTFSADASVHP